MALIQKRPYVTSDVPAYSIGAVKTLLIIGLGNPGKDYEDTRHNIGFAALDHFAKQNDFPTWTKKKDLKCLVTQANMGENRVILSKPTTFMNLSGEAAQALQRFYRVYNKQTLAVYDELAIPFGQLRTRAGGTDAGHNGVKSLIQHLGEDFGRLRIGIGSEATKNADAADYVLKRFSKEEQGHLPQILREANALITEFIFGDRLPHETRTIL
ncbi:aminoacyl-tRNA hydrolase [Candidatus Saccharibacteria bacterium]|nr:aminoacyl-tRNA hydrolase [Candidatus Saccharibacteria bacterium]